MILIFIWLNLVGMITWKNFLLLSVLIGSTVAGQKKQPAQVGLPKVYFPGAQVWEQKTPAEAGLNADKIKGVRDSSIKIESISSIKQKLKGR
jgi:hypothetical protein